MNSWKEHYWYGIPVARARIEEIVRRVSINGPCKVLDAGCNEGFLSQALKEAGHTVTSIDVDESVIKKAREYFNIDAIKADVIYMPFLNESFDVAVGGEILEHIENPGDGLAELFRVAKDRVILSLPIGAYWLGELTHKWCIDLTAIEHDQGTKDELIKKVVVMEFIKRKLC